MFLYYIKIKIIIGADDDNENPPIPPTHHPIINRLTSRIDESLVNLILYSQDAEIEQERALYEFEQIFIRFRTYIEKYYHRYKSEIQSSYTNYDQNLYELKLRLKQIRQQLIQDFTSIQNHDNDNDNYRFDTNKYRRLEILATQIFNQIIDQQKSLPKYRIKLNNIDQLEKIFSIQCEQNLSKLIFECDNIDQNVFVREITPIPRSASIGKYY